MSGDLPEQPDRLKRVLDKLAERGWIDRMGVTDTTSEREGIAAIKFTEFGLAHISAFYRLHDGLWDMPAEDFEVFHALLLSAVLDGMERAGMIQPDTDGE